MTTLAPLLLTFCSLVCIAGCARDSSHSAPSPPPPNPQTSAVPPSTQQFTPAPMTYDLPTLARAYNGFGLRLLSQLQQQFPLQNTFISPMSIAMALAMTYNGARGETERAMAETLGVPGMSRHTLNQLNQTVLENLANADNSVDLTIANSLWARHDIPFVPAFLSAVRAAYRAELANVNFLAPDTCPRINRWVEQATRNRITDLIQPADLNEETILILINAIYFKGKWERPFDPAATQELPFTCANGAVKQHPFMAQSARFHYHQDHQVQIVRLPYGKGRLSMRVILPAPGLRITDILATLDEARWRAWNDALQSREGTVKLPRFKMEYAAELTAPLSALGMAIAFDRQRADFRDMATIRERICISAVRHKAFIEVNEEGTEAAAATGVVMARVTAIMPTERFMMICDRPFLYAICDDETGLLLFLGTVQQL